MLGLGARWGHFVPSGGMVVLEQRLSTWVVKEMREQLASGEALR